MIYYINNKGVRFNCFCGMHQVSNVSNFAIQVMYKLENEIPETRVLDEHFLYVGKIGDNKKLSFVHDDEIYTLCLKFIKD